MNQTGDTKEYEISFLSTKQDGEVAVTGILTQYGATILEKRPLTEIRLSYPIKKHQQALFGCITFRVTADSVVKIQQSLKLQPEIIRMITITPPVRVQEPRERKYDAKAPREKREKTDATGPAPSMRTQSNVLSNEALKEQLAVLEGGPKNNL
ncbi:MAG: 30S ribosomal protein S6 [bacterium]|nr:30S ribosomal protein S6 [bacterium]